MTATNNDHDDHNRDGHKPFNHDDQLGGIYPTMLNELNCTFGVKCFMIITLISMASETAVYCSIM